MFLLSQNCNNIRFKTTSFLLYWIKWPPHVQTAIPKRLFRAIIRTSFFGDNGIFYSSCVLCGIGPGRIGHLRSFPQGSEITDNALMQRVTQVCHENKTFYSLLRNGNSCFYCIMLYRSQKIDSKYLEIVSMVLKIKNKSICWLFLLLRPSKQAWSFSVFGFNPNEFQICPLPS